MTKIYRIVLVLFPTLLIITSFQNCSQGESINKEEVYISFDNAQNTKGFVQTIQCSEEACLVDIIEGDEFESTSLQSLVVDFHVSDGSTRPPKSQNSLVVDFSVSNSPPRRVKKSAKEQEANCQILTYFTDKSYTVTCPFDIYHYDGIRYYK